MVLEEEEDETKVVTCKFYLQSAVLFADPFPAFISSDAWSTSAGTVQSFTSPGEVKPCWQMVMRLLESPPPDSLNSMAFFIFLNEFSGRRYLQ